MSPVPALAVCSGSWIEASDAALQVFGVQRSDLPLRARDVLTARDEESFRKALRGEISDDGVSLRLRIRPRVGAEHEVAATVTRCPDSSQRACVHLELEADMPRGDLTDARTDEFDALVTFAAEYAVMTVGLDGGIRSWNRGAERLFGFRTDEAIGRPVVTLYTLSDQSAGVPDRDEREAAAQGISRQFERWQASSAGPPFMADIAIAPLRDASGTVTGYTRVVRDITDRETWKRNAANLEQTVERVAREWRGTVDAVDLIILLLDENRAIRRLNRAAQQLIGLGFQSVVSRPLGDFKDEPWATADGLAASLLGGWLPRLESEARAGGRVWQVEATRAFQTMARTAVVVIRDVTATRRLEESMRRTEVASALGTMVARVAHEVRRPLFQLSATFDVCTARSEEHSVFHRYSPQMRSSLATLRALLEELLDYSRPQKLEYATFSPLATLREAIVLCDAHARDREVSIQLSVANPPETCWYDGARVLETLQNVLENAAQHTPPGGTVTALVRAAEGGGVEFVVSDGGPGFSAEDLENAVHPFYTRRPGGSGLGLAVVKKILDAHGGALRLQNQVTGGANVSLTLPGPSGLNSSHPASV